MKVLFLSSMALFRGTRFGGSKRLYYFARELEERADLALVCLDGCREYPRPADLRGEFRRALFLEWGARKSPLRRLLSLPVVVDEEVERQRKSLEDFLAGDAFDATFLAYPLALSFLGKGWDARMGRRVYLEDDLLIESYRAQAREGGPLRRAKGALRHRQAGTYFRDKLAGMSSLVCISREEEAIMRALFPGRRTSVLKYGVPLGDYPPLPPGDPLALGFIGNFRHLPNVDAALWAAGTLFPSLAGRVPGLRLVIAGRDMPREVRAACAAHPAIRVLEGVESLADFYGTVGLFLNPVREGRGLRTKLVEAAAFGRPALSTPLGAEGLEDLRVATWEDTEGLLAAWRGLAEPARYRETAEANRRTVEARYSTRAVGAELLEILGS